MSVAISAFRMQTMFGSSLPLVVCRRAPALFTLFECLRIVVSNTYCAVLCLCFVCVPIVSCVPYVANFLWIVLLDCPFGFSHVYFPNVSTSCFFERTVHHRTVDIV